MADGIVQLQPNSTGPKVDTSELTVGTNVVERQRVSIADSSSASGLAGVSAANGLAVDVTRVQGAVASAQSGAWSVTANVGATNGLALDASIAGLQVAQGSSTSGQKGELALGAVTTAAPTYTSGQTQPLSLSTAGALRVDASATTQPVSGAVTANQGGAWSVSIGAALPAGGNVIGAVTQSGTWTIQPGNTANTTPWLASINAGGNTATVKTASTAIAATDQALAVGLHPSSAVPLPALTKATQGTTGVSTQALKDAGRSSRSITLDSFAVAATTETLNTMSVSADNGTATTGASYSVTTAKRFRLQQITASLHTIAGNTTAVNVIVRLRVNNAGAAVVTSPVQFIFAIQGIAAANQAGMPVTINIPDGYEIAGGAGVGVTTQCAGFVATTAAPKVNIALTGYEY